MKRQRVFSLTGPKWQSDGGSGNVSGENSFHWSHQLARVLGTGRGKGEAPSKNVFRRPKHTINPSSKHECQYDMLRQLWPPQFIQLY